MDETQLATILLRDTSLTRDQLDSAMESQRLEGGMLFDVLLKAKVLSEEDLLRAIAMQFGVEYLSNLDADEVDPELVAELPINYAKTHQILPSQ